MTSAERHQVQSAIQGHNVMPVLDFDKDAREWFTMPLAESTLSSLSLPLGTEALAEVVRDTARGLAAAHVSGHVHRDVKPSQPTHIEPRS